MEISNRFYTFDPAPAFEKPLIDTEWDPLRGKHVRVACCTAQNLHHRMVGALFEAVTHCMQFQVTVSLQFVQTSIVSSGRDRAILNALEAGATHLFFVDSDIVIPKDCIVRLMWRDKDIVSGLYPNRHDEICVAFAQKSSETEHEPGHTSFSWQVLNQPGLHPASAAGAGCLMVKREALERMRTYWESLPEQAKLLHRSPWFEYKSQGPESCIGEDIAFSEMATEAGCEFYVDSSVLCAHIGETLYEFTPGHKETTITIAKVNKRL